MARSQWIGAVNSTFSPTGLPITDSIFRTVACPAASVRGDDHRTRQPWNPYLADAASHGVTQCRDHAGSGLYRSYRDLVGGQAWNRCAGGYGVGLLGVMLMTPISAGAVGGAIGLKSPWLALPEGRIAGQRPRGVELRLVLSEGIRRRGVTVVTPRTDWWS